jgi:predicted membrane metal-binding protein
MAGLLWTIFVIILAIWLIGFLLDVAGGLIHILLIIAAIILLYNLLVGRRTAL